MNGRAYDYNLGRFLSVDPFIEFPENSQSLNPYSYILNNPLSSTDPSGYLSHCGKVITCGTADPHTGFKNVNRGALRNGTENILEAVSSPASSLGLSNIGSSVFRLNFETNEDGEDAPGIFQKMRAGTQNFARRTAGVIGDLQLEIDDATFDSGFAAFYLGRVVQEFALAPLEDVTKAIANGDATGLGIAAAGALFKPIRAGEKVLDTAKNVGKAGDDVPNRIYSARELVRRADEPGPFHNFPESFNESIFKGDRKIISDNYVMYSKRGSLNGRTGNFEIGVEPSASGRTEVITHRFFRPDSTK